MEKLKLQTTDMVDGNVRRIGELFPNCLTETKDENGRPRLSIDFDQLRQELSRDIVEGPEERYQFTWPDKRNAIRLANAPINDTLRPIREDETTPTGVDSKGKPYCSSGSVNFDTTQNLYIEGDNLQVLKLLREDYLGKIKMIYIDPPYNTGNDFVYNDSYKMNSSVWSDSSGDYDEEGHLLTDSYTINTEGNGRFHTDWLNMIYPRLKVAKDLLSPNGIICISINEYEVENLRKVCDEIFGQSNIISQLVWKNKYGAGGGTNSVASINEYILVYSRSTLESITCPLSDELAASYNQTDEKYTKRGGYVTQPLASTSKGARANLMYPIHHEGAVINPPTGGRWIWSKEKFEKAYANNEIIINKTSSGYSVRFKQYLYDENGIKRRGTQLSIISDVFNQEGSKEFGELFGDKRIFDFPKPTKLIRKLLDLQINKEENDEAVVLDFFSGSATTAHAVMQLNAEDGGHRKFIMVQLPEATDENSEAYKVGYKNICEIGKERIRRAGKKIKEESPLTTQDLDTGFRVLKLDSSNMEDVYVTPGEFTEGSLFANNIKPDRSEEDLLFQVMIEMGIDLSSKIERKEIAGKTVWNVAQNYLLACFDEQVNETAITEIAKQQPAYFVMRDSSLANDQVADNFEQIWKLYSADTERRIV